MTKKDPYFPRGFGELDDLKGREMPRPKPKEDK